jgi:hypothetical protein
VTCKLPEETATLLKHYAEFLDSTQEHVILETLRLAFRRDKEFHAWLATTSPETRVAEPPSATRPVERLRPPHHRPPTSVVGADGRADVRSERTES